MAYTTINFKTKKQFKEYVVAGKEVGIYSPGPFPCNTEGTVCIEGPHYPEPHRWYATARVKNGIVVSVK